MARASEEEKEEEEEELQWSLKASSNRTEFNIVENASDLRQWRDGSICFCTFTTTQIFVQNILYLFAD